MKNILTILLLVFSFSAFSQTYTIKEILVGAERNDTFCIKTASPDTIWRKSGSVYTFYYKNTFRRYLAFSNLVGLPTTAAGYGITDVSSSSHTHTYSEITGKPTLFDGAYNSLTGKPTLFDGVYSSLTGKPSVVLTTDTTGLLASHLTSIIASAAAITLKAPLASPTFTGVAALPTVTTSGKITNYNSIATVSNGVPSIVAEVNLTTQAANIGSTALYAVPAAGFYRVSSYLTVTQAATTSSTMPSLTIGYTDGNSGTNLHSTAVSASSATNTVTGAFGQSTYVLYAKTGTNITYQTASYATSGATPMQYALRIRVEAL